MREKQKGEVLTQGRGPNMEKGMYSIYSIGKMENKIG
jgi:hypothetical protein